ncbi:hypothetical protein CI109_107252 [Kwoniella shandongensis]|uniref:Uncharacterized protein n=1 Tax=Kwoniella shandongensis TaxID=1734106 RepID=A0A5M6C2E6_9TREE|nr:uncharacterized protein CI109_002535 [Kwoniella shandongensis]KAA5529194.1 hypothetical protein CI109_002535 [Kwoniella shandongensis]
MWLLTAIGPVHGQSKFTFVLERKKEYTVGRDGCDIPFSSRSVRPKEGTLIVEDWSPTQRHKAPSLKWRSEPKKNGTFGQLKVLCLRDTADVGSTDKDDYDTQDLGATQGCYLDSGDHGETRSKVEGVMFSEDVWFTTEWKDLSLQYDKMKDESDQVRDVLRTYCIAWTQAFEINNRPDYVLSTYLRSSLDCNYAVCFGVPIVLPSFLEALIGRLHACWKKMADSQDSFTLPDENEYQPEFDPHPSTALPASRKERRTWLPDKSRETLFSGWKVMGLRGRVAPQEKRYVVAMGADYQDIDVLGNPVTTSEDFADRLSDWLNYLDENGGREQAIVVWFSNVKKELTNKGVDFTAVISTTCLQMGVALSSGGIVWGAVSMEGVRSYLEASAANLPAKEKAPVRDAHVAVPDLPPHAQSSQALPSSTNQSVTSTRPDYIPSTFPDETTGANARSPSPETRSSKPVRRARQKTSPPREKSPEPTSSIARKPLRRRAGKPVPEFSQFPNDPPESDTENDNSQPSQPQPSFVQDSMPMPREETMSRFTQPTQPTDIDTITQTQQTSQAPRRLKRRAGGTAPSLIQEIADTSINAERDVKAEETAAEIRELYEQTELSKFKPNPSKKPRLDTDARHEPVESSTSSRVSARTRAHDSSVMEIDDDEDDLYAQTMKKAIRSKRGGTTQPQTQTQMPPPAQRNRQIRSPSEEQEEVEEIVQSIPRAVVPKSQSGTITSTKSKSKTNDETASTVQPTTDAAFLKAITSASKAKKGIDELDKEFNQLRIPKANGKSAVVKANEWDASHPDYSIVNDFDDELRGNFIQIVRKDLFRKDIGEKADRTVGRVDDGRPNFKKFKKKNVIRREPLPLVLTGPTVQAAEMGEPYWPTQAIKTGNRRTQAGSQAPIAEEEDDMPLLPRSRKRLLGTQALQDDDTDMPFTGRTSTQRRKVVPETQNSSMAGSQLPLRRNARGASVVSESSVGTSTSVATSTTRGGGGTRAKAPSKPKTRGKEPIVLEDSGEEDGVDRGNSRSGKGTGTVTLEEDDDDDDVVASTAMGVGRSRLTQSTRSSAKAAGSGSGVGGRRKLLPVDDEDGMAFRGLGKKRRLG